MYLDFVSILMTLCSPESIRSGKSFGLMSPETWNKELFCSATSSLPNVALLLLNL